MTRYNKKKGGAGKYTTFSFKKRFGKTRTSKDPGNSFKEEQ